VVAPARLRQRGFTLLELLVVITIVAMVSVGMTFAYDRWQSGADYRKTVDDFTAAVQRARQHAIETAHPVAIVLDLQQRRHGLWWVSQNEQPQWLPAWSESLQVRVDVAEGVVPAPWLGVVFLPDGGSTGGTIDVLRAPLAGTRIRIDWLSGRVSQRSIAP